MKILKIKIIKAFLISFILLLSSCTQQISSEYLDNSSASINNKPTNTQTESATIFTPAYCSENETISDNNNHQDVIDYEINGMLNAMITGDIDTFSKYTPYIEGSNGFLSKSGIKSYKILDRSLSLLNSVDCYYNYFVELEINDSNDNRFDNGSSRWNIGMLYVERWQDYTVNCVYFLPEHISIDNIYHIGQNKYADLSYYFTFSFNCFETVSDIRKYCFNMNGAAFVDGVRAFVRIADEEVMPQITNEYGDIYYSKEDVNTIIFKYLGITDYSWDDNFIGLGGDRLWKVWDMTTVYAVITEQTDSYIDMVYFADYVYLTPAKKMRYYFTYINDSIQLTGTELIEDYGYEPNWNMY